MKISTKGRYGIRSIAELAINYGKEPLSIKSISERQDISEYYLEQIFAKLRKAGIIKSTRGSQGGYTLTRKPSEITIYDVLNPLEGPVEISECLQDVKCDKENCCPAKNLWGRVQKSINEVLINITLQDLVDDYNKMK